MLYSLGFTVLMIVNFLFFVIGTAFLPEQVAIVFGADLMPKAVGSPWVFTAFPAAAALISAALFLTMLLKRERAKNALSIVLSVLSCALITLGWVFFSLIKSGSVLERAVFPYALSVLLPLALLLSAAGGMMICFKRSRHARPEREKSVRVLRLTGAAFLGVGIVGAVLTVVVCCFL